MTLDCWTKIIIEPLKDRLVKLLLEQIHLSVDLFLFSSFNNSYYFSDRICECVNQTTIKGVIMSFVDVYQHRKLNILEVKTIYLYEMK
jgi:hypothetical protein